MGLRFSPIFFFLIRQRWVLIFLIQHSPTNGVFLSYFGVGFFAFVKTRARFCDGFSRSIRFFGVLVIFWISSLYLSEF